MSSLLLVARLVLVLVFSVAGVAKLADRRGSLHAVASFGVPELMARPLAIALPLLELGIAGGLVAGISSRWAALTAVALLLVFAAATAVSLASGHRPACHCFGELSQKPAGRWTLIRTCALAALASGLLVALFVEPAPSLPRQLARFASIEVAVFALGVVLVGLTGFAAWFVSELLRQNGRLLRRLEAVEGALGARPAATAASAPSPLTLGQRAPVFRSPTAAGGEASLAGLLARGRPVLLVFTDPHCGPCRALLPEIADMQRRLAGSLTLAVVMSGSLADARSFRFEHPIEDLLVTADGAIARAYGAIGTPSALVVGPDGLIASTLARGSRAVRALIEQSAAEVGGAPSSPWVRQLRAATMLTVGAGGHAH